MDTEQREQPPNASEWDRAYMRRLGRYKHESHEQARLEHLACAPNDRLASGFMMWAWAAKAPTWSFRVDDPSPFYERAKQLGFYRG